jgi:hypothetical protein
MDTVAALVATAFAAALLVLTALNAGPLWRDETNSLNMAQMPSLRELWNNLPFDSVPLLWLLLLRLWSFFGLADSDLGVRIFGLLIGLSFLGSLWLCARWVTRRTPVLSLALLVSLPAFYFTVQTNRAYGMAMCLLVMTFGLIWRVVEAPTRWRTVQAGLVALLFVHCVYYDAIFLCAMLLGAAFVAVRRGHWNVFAALVIIGVAAGLSLTIYVPVIRRASELAPMWQLPFFKFSIIWRRLGEAVTSQSTSKVGWPGREIWLWVSLVFVGIVIAVAMQWRWVWKKNSLGTSFGSGPSRADLALFSCVTVLCGASGYLWFLLNLKYPTLWWYYLGLLSLCAICLEGVLTANLPTQRPWPLLRTGFLAIMMMWGARSVWEEAHTRRTNLDVVAHVLAKQAHRGDLIVVQSAWEGITFDRYYHGSAYWMTLPPIESHKVHRTDLVWERLSQPEPISPVLHAITRTLRNGNRVWLVGNVAFVNPGDLPPPPPLPRTKCWLGPYTGYWGAQVMAHLSANAQQCQTIDLQTLNLVNSLEDLPLLKFEGLKSGMYDAALESASHQ